MPDPLEVKIGHERASLLLVDAHPGVSTRSQKGELWGFHARLSLPGLEAASLVWLAPPDLEEPLPDVFHELARNWRGWTGAKDWETYEGGLRLSFVHDGLGHVAMTVELREYSSRNWVAQGAVPIDAGQLESVADQLGRFFGLR